MSDGRPDDLTGKVAVVTGGSSGIGAAAVRALAACGATTVIGYNRGAERAEALAKTLPGTGHRALRLAVEDSAGLKAAASAVEDAYGRADILVNSAGTTRRVPHADLDGLDDDTIDLILTTNVRGPFATIRAFAPLLRATGSGVVVSVSSGSAFTGRGSNVVYCASKAAVDTMTISLARVLGPEIRLLCVSPGYVNTGFVPGMSADEIERATQSSPLKRDVSAEDVADAVVACVTHLRRSTGIRVIVDSGRHLV